MDEFRADLHCHTLFSDGTDTPKDLIKLAIEKGLNGLAITDHDTVAGYIDGELFAKQSHFPLLSGVEFSTIYQGEPIHILGYAFRPQSLPIQELCLKHHRRRQERNHAILEKLKILGIHIDPKIFEGLEGSWGRPHIAHALMQMGRIQSIQEAFDLYLAEGKPAYVMGNPITVVETLQIIHEAGGKAVLAHPHLIKRKRVIKELLRMPFDGLECYYARLPLEQEKKWIDLAKQRKWLITGGSDYHGTTKPYSVLGASWVGKETFDALYNHFLNHN